MYSMARRKLLLVLTALLILVGASCFSFARAVPTEDCRLSDSYFKIKVIDDRTGRGVPLIELKTTNNLSFTTDSAGVIAIHEPGLMNQNVFFHIASHGYEYPKDGFGYRGKRFDIKPGASATLKIKRLNIAERLYRLTGQGIYRDSIIAGAPVPLKNPAINALVMGQDSVQTCKYKGLLYWFWGDTARPSYPLGNFSMAGATSRLPRQGGLDPSVGVDFQYFTDKNGFAQKMFPMSEPGMVWSDGFLTVEDPSGKPRMIAQYARVKGLDETYERGLAVFNDESNTFELLIRSSPDFLLYHGLGHPISIDAGNVRYYYFATPFPLAARMRVRATWQHVTDPNRYEVFTSLHSPQTRSATAPHRWVSTEELLHTQKWEKSQLISALEKEKEDESLLYDIAIGQPVAPHGGTVYWNEYRRKWIMITVQQFGDPSFLGEVWYAEADTPLGPWGYARKIVTHNKYSFYNPKQHPYFDQDNGRLIYFEGTYSHTFSGRPEDATPRYDYNQVMYRLDLSDRHLFLPAPVYKLRSTQGRTEFLLGQDIRRKKPGLKVEAIPFYAIPPDRMYEGLVPIYAHKTKDAGFALTKTPPSDSSQPLFYGLLHNPSKDTDGSPVIPLFEYRHKKTKVKTYSTEDMTDNTWLKSPAPLCYVWKTPSNLILADWQARPANQ